MKKIGLVMLVAVLAVGGVCSVCAYLASGLSLVGSAAAGALAIYGGSDNSTPDYDWAHGLVPLPLRAALR